MRFGFSCEISIFQKTNKSVKSKVCAPTKSEFIDWALFGTGKKRTFPAVLSRNSFILFFAPPRSILTSPTQCIMCNFRGVRPNFPIFCTASTLYLRIFWSNFPMIHFFYYCGFCDDGFFYSRVFLAVVFSFISCCCRYHEYVSVYANTVCVLSRFCFLSFISN